MKNLYISTLLFFILITSAYAIHTKSKQGSPDPVLDTDGNELRVGEIYFSRSVIRGAGGGGIFVAGLPNTTCIFAVAQENLDILPGETMTFSPANSERGDVIRESTDLNVMFALSFGCRPPSVWRVDDYDESTQQNFIMLGGVAGNPGNETISSWFKIEKGVFGYKFVFCPSVCDFCTVKCSDIGVYLQNWIRRLALTDRALEVEFQKFKPEHHKY